MSSTLARTTARTLTAAAAVALMAATPAVAQTAWDMPTPYPDATFHTQNIQQFAKDVEEATGGSLTITVHPGGSLIKHPEIKASVRSGIVPVGEYLLSSTANDSPVFGVDSVPFLATDYDASMKLWEASKPATESLLKEQGLRVLFSVPWPPQGLYTVEPVDEMSDLAGMKFRAYNPATERIAVLAGAVPTQVEVPDLPQAFATGRVEAMITSPSTGANSKAWDYVNHYYDTKAWLPKNIVVVSERAFGRLDEATQQALLDAAAKAQERGWSMSKEETEAKTAILKENGMTVQDPSQDLLAGFGTIGEEMAAEWAASAGDTGTQILDTFRSSMQ